MKIQTIDEKNNHLDLFEINPINYLPRKDEFIIWNNTVYKVKYVEWVLDGAYHVPVPHVIQFS